MTCLCAAQLLVETSTRSYFGQVAFERHVKLSKLAQRLPTVHPERPHLVPVDEHCI